MSKIGTLVPLLSVLSDLVAWLKVKLNKSLSLPFNNIQKNLNLLFYLLGSVTS
jgi:hypothetical protein